MHRPAALLFFLMILTAAAQVAMWSDRSPHFTLAPGSPFKAGDRPNDIAVADVNGDGALDILTANAGDRAVAVLLGNGSGSFQPAPGSPFAIAEPVHMLVASDFNGDRKVDVAVTAHDSNDVALLLGDGRGALRPAPGSPFPAFPGVKPHNHGLAAGDMNGDGHVDLTLGHQDTGAIAVLLGDGRGSFEPAQGSPFHVGRGFYPHALGDMNGDGNLDVVAPDIVGSAIVVALGDGRGALATAGAPPFRVKPRPFFVLLEDVDADSRLDAIVTHDDIEDVDVLRGDGRGGFAGTAQFRAGHRGWTIAAADLNRDTRQDLLIAGATGIKTLLGNGKGEFTVSPEWSLATRAATWKLAVADFNQDKRADLVFPEVEAGTLTVMLQR